MPQSNDPNDPHNLTRFLRIQNTRGHYATALSEMRAGAKESHWIWFVFPQLAGLSAFPSQTARRYAVRSAAEARAYLAHPVLGRRLREIGLVVAESEVRDVGELMGGEVDSVKLRSCMTLFKWVVGRMGDGEREEGDEVFGRVLEKYFGGEDDERTVEMLEDLP
jgi:uncharacterized protein (DUF1810 family)